MELSPLGKNGALPFDPSPVFLSRLWQTRPPIQRERFINHRLVFCRDDGVQRAPSLLHRGPKKTSKA